MKDFDLDRIVEGKPYKLAMEQHNTFKCYLSYKPELYKLVAEKSLNFFKENHFLVGTNMFDPEWSNEIQAEEIFKKLILIYGFEPTDENLVIVRGPEVVYFRDHRFVKLSAGDILAYDSTKIEVGYEGVNK